MQVECRSAEEIYSLMSMEALQVGFPKAYSDDFHFWDLLSLRQSEGTGRKFIWILREYGTYLVIAPATSAKMYAFLLSETREPDRLFYFVDPTAERCLTQIYRR